MCGPEPTTLAKNYNYDITRLKNLLRNYRDSIITVRANKHKEADIVEIIEEVDNAIKVLGDGL